MEIRQNSFQKNTIQPTAEVNQPFGTDKSVPYEHTGRGSIHPTFVNQVKPNNAEERGQNCVTFYLEFTGFWWYTFPEF